MKKIKGITLFSLLLCFILCLTACGEEKEPIKEKEEIEIIQNDEKTHYLKFMENNAEVLRIVVLENETYEDLLPYFPTLTEEDGFIKYWDGDYTYTSYTHENQFKVYNKDDSVIEVYAYMKKID